MGSLFLSVRTIAVRKEIASSASLDSFGGHAKSIVAWFPGAVHATGNLVDLKLYGRGEFRTEHSNR